MEFGDRGCTVLISAEIALRIRPVFTPSGLDEHDVGGRDRSVSGFPLREVFCGEKVVGVLGTCGGDVDDDGGRDKAGDGDLVGAGMSFGEVERAVEMRAAMLAGAVACGGVEVSARGWTPGVLLPLEAVSGGPIEGVLVEGVGEIDEVGVREVNDVRGGLRDSGGEAEKQRQEGNGAGHGEHYALPGGGCPRGKNTLWRDVVAMELLPSLADCRAGRVGEIEVGKGAAVSVAESEHFEADWSCGDEGLAAGVEGGGGRRAFLDEAERGERLKFALQLRAAGADGGGEFVGVAG